MNGLRFVFRILSLLKIIIMLFIRFAPNYYFVRKNHQKRTRLKRLFKLCFLLIDNVIHDLLQAENYGELNIKSHHQCRVGATALPKIHHNEKKSNLSKEII
jgi:hypothetical protein